MASIEAALEARAVAVAGLTALIGTSPTRFYPVESRQGGALPRVNYTVVSDPPFHVMVADQESQARVQFDIWAANWASARAVRDQLLVAFDRWSGLSGGTTVLASVCESRGFQVQDEEAAPDVHRFTLEFLVTYIL